MRQNILKDYMSEIQNQSLREDSVGKSTKKKGGKKVTPKNVIAVGTFSQWL